MDIEIFPPEDIVEARVELPLSKSVSARALVINAVGGFDEVPVVADCDDTEALKGALGQREGHVDVGAAGTAMRFMTAFYAACEGCDVVLDGSERMRQRPVGILVDALRALGADIEYEDCEGFAPLHIRGRRLKGGVIDIDASVSSQFVSALMMVAPAMEQGLALNLGWTVSLPYIIMTARMMQAAGAVVEMDRDLVRVATGAYKRPCMLSERDWSAASYWYSVAALSGGFVTLPGLSRDSVQGDRAMEGFGARLGAVTQESEEEDEDALELCASPDPDSALDLYLADNPDLAQTVAVCAAVQGITFRLRGLSTLRDKETDRLQAMVTELDKLGIVACIDNDALVWDGKRHPVFEMPEIETYKDHRMAMAFAPVSIFVPGLVIRDAGVVSKSYPGFWEDLQAAGFVIKERE